MEKEENIFFNESINNFQKLLFINKNEKVQYFLKIDTSNNFLQNFSYKIKKNINFFSNFL